MRRFLPCLALLSACAGLQLHSKMAKELLGPLSEPKPARVAVVPFSGAGPGDQQYEKLFREGLTTALSRSGKIAVVERELTARLLQEHKFSLSGAVDPKSAKQIGRLLGVDALVTGTVIRSDAKRLEINARLVDVETGRILSAVRKVVQRKEGAAPAQPRTPASPKTWAPSDAPAPPAAAPPPGRLIPRGSMEAAVVGSEVLLIGGGDGLRVTPEIESYDPRTGEARVIGRLPFIVGSVCAFSGEGRAFFAGGCAEGDCRNVNAGLFSVSPADGSVRRVGDMPTPRIQSAAVTLGDWAYCISGGRACPGQCSSSVVEAYNFKKGVWKSLSPVAFGRRSGAAAALNGKIYFLGGYEEQSNDSSRWVERYDPAEDAWTRLKDLPLGLEEPRAVALEGKLYALGGVTRHARATDTFLEYDEAKDRWIALPPMPSPLWDHAAMAIDGEIVVIGGFKSFSMRTSESPAWAWNPRTGRWRTLPAP